MNKRSAMSWVKALRSGKYKQGKGKLYDPKNNTYCCLGVRARQKGISKDTLFNKEYLNEVDKNFCGLNSSDGSGTDDCGYALTIKFDSGQFSSLSEANDSGVSFKKIAAWIEKNYRKL